MAESASKDTLTGGGLPSAGEARTRLERLRARRFAEDDRQVCWARAEILRDAAARYSGLPVVTRQAAVIRELCERIPVVIEPEDIIVGRMPEVVPTPEQERFVSEHPEFFCFPGVPGLLDSMSIYVPDWGMLTQQGIGGIMGRLQLVDSAPGEGRGADADRHTFSEGACAALASVGRLFERYAARARDLASDCADPRRGLELSEIASRCQRLAVDAPASFVDALQQLQLVHMVLSCLIGGRDVTPGRLDQYLYPLYRRDIASGAMDRDLAIVLLAMFMLRISQMGGHGTDFDDNVRRTPCRYTHLYVTVGGVDTGGQDAVNELSRVVLDAARLLRFREPTILVRYRPDAARSWRLAVAGLIRERIPVTVYHDEMVVRALLRQGVDRTQAREYAHSACHNVVVAGYDAGTGVGGFHNIPALLLLAMNGGRDPVTGEQVGAATPRPADLHDLDAVLGALTEQVRFRLKTVRRQQESQWVRDRQEAMPLLQSALMRHSVDARRSCWHSAPFSHHNHYFMGLGTTVDSLSAIRELVYERQELSLPKLLDVLIQDWEGHDALRAFVRSQTPRFGQDHHEPRAFAAQLGRMWVREVEHASRGMTRNVMWPAFYSHMTHAHSGSATTATPDGRRKGDALSENVSPSYGTTGCTPTSILRSMSVLPFDHTPSGAASLTLSTSDVAGAAGAERIVDLLDTYFRMGGLHMQVNVVDAGELEDALVHPERHRELVVRVTGFSAYFTDLTRPVQEDLVRRFRRDTSRPA